MKKIIFVFLNFNLLLVLFANVIFANEHSDCFNKPSQRFIAGISEAKLNQLLIGFNSQDLDVFNNLIKSEDDGFFGYHAAPQIVGAYQDIIKMSIQHILGLDVRNDFQFLRIPGDDRLNYNNSIEFLKEYNIYKKEVIKTAQMIQNSQPSPKTVMRSKQNATVTEDVLSLAQALKIIGNFKVESHSKSPGFKSAAVSKTVNSELVEAVGIINDMTKEIQTKILSINMALYQTEFGHNPLTLYAYKYNTAYSSIVSALTEELRPFFDKLGISSDYIAGAFDLAYSYLPKENGVILQLSEKNLSIPYKFIDTHGYISHPYGMPLGNKKPSYYVMTESVNNFPELKLLMANKHSLNPNSSLIIKRVGNDNGNRPVYEQALKDYLMNLPRDEEKASKYKEYLEKLWG